MNSIDSFKERIRTEKVAQERLSVKFIYDGINAVKIILNGAEIPAALVYKEHGEELDGAEVFVENKNALTVGNIFSWYNKNFIVIEEMELAAKNILFKKYLVKECNFLLDGIYGWIKGLGSYIRTILKDDQVIVSDIKPLLVVAGNPYKVGDTIKVADRPFKIAEMDNFSKVGLSYYSLEATREERDTTDDIYIEPVEPTPADVIQVRPLQEVEIATEQGYFKSSIVLNENRMPLKVRFVVPSYASEFEVEVKSGGEVLTQKYKVVL